MKSLHAILNNLPSPPRFEDKAQRRAGGNIVKFAAGLLVLTLIARGTSGATLARVELSVPERSEIVGAVTGSATVRARDTVDIFAPEGLTVLEMLAGAGQTVTAGSAVARLDIDELRERLTREAARLDELRLDLEKLERGVDTDSASLESAQRTLNRALEDYEATKAQGEADIAQAQAALDEAMQGLPETVDTAALESAKRTLNRAKEDYNNTKAQGESDVAAAYSAYYNAQSDENAKYNEWQLDPTDPAAEQAYQAARSKTESALSALNSARSRADENLLSAARRVEDAEIAYAKAEQDYNKNVEQASQAVQTEIDRANDALEAAIKKAEENLLSAQRRVEDAEASLAKARQDYGKSMQQSADTAAQNSLSAVSLRLDIDNQKEIVDELSILAENEGVIYAGITGVVSSAAAEGSVTGKDAVVAFIDSAKGFEAGFQISRAQAELLAVGDECRVTTGGGTMYYSPTVNGMISAIAPPDEQDNVQVTVRLPQGDWTGGQRVEVQVVCSRDTYDMCVPLSALRSGSLGYYLLVVEQKSTIMGVENVVTSVPVTIVDSDDEMAAVQGPVDRGSRIITGSSRAVAAGDRVRISEQ